MNSDETMKRITDRSITYGELTPTEQRERRKYAFGSDQAFPGGAAMRTEGLTKREYFAAKAMQGIVASHFPEQHGYVEKMVAKSAIQLADALIAELSK